MVGKAAVPELLTTDWLLQQFARQRREAQRQFRLFILAGEPEEPEGSIWKYLRGQCLLGGEAFVNAVMPKLKEKSTIREIPREQRFTDRPPLSELQLRGFPSRSARDEAIVQGHCPGSP